MNEYQKGDPDKILKKVTNVPAMALVLLIVSFLFLAMCIYGIVIVSRDKASVIFIIFGGILFLTFFILYFFQKRKIKKNIKDIDLERVKRDIMEGVISYDVNKTYFTRNFILSNFYYGFIIEYKDILWVYKRTLYDPNTLLPRHDLVICHKNGKKYYTEYSDDFIEKISKNNKNVLVGNDPLNKEKYKELLKEING